MRKLLFIILIITGIVSCSKDESEIITENYGSIYGVVTVKETAELMRATGVELYSGGSLLLKTVTYDDGHYEFENLTPGYYELKVVASGYHDASYSVVVESNRTARADMQLERLDTHMTVTTLPATNIEGNKATLNGLCSHSGYSQTPDEVGFIYSMSPSPINGGIKVKSTLSSFECIVNGLNKGKYYYQAYAINYIGISYGEIQTFEINGAPVINTLAATNVTATTATLNGRIDYEGDPVYTERGFVYSSSFSNPTIDDPTTATTKIVVSGRSKEFSANIAGLTTQNAYYVRAYAKNNTTTIYGNSIKFPEDDYIDLTADGIMIHKTDISSQANWNTANDLCSSSNVGGFSNWRLPTTGECQIIKSYMSTMSLYIIPTDRYWASNIYNSEQAFCYSFNTGYDYFSKSKLFRVRCVRTK